MRVAPKRSPKGEEIRVLKSKLKPHHYLVHSDSSFFGTITGRFGNGDSRPYKWVFTNKRHHVHYEAKTLKGVIEKINPLDFPKYY